MTCEQVLDQLPDYTLGTLSEVETAAVRRHLRGCASCRADAASLDQGIAMFSGAAAEEPPAELEGRVLSVLSEEWSETMVPAPPRRLRIASWLATAAAIIAVGALVWGSAAQMSANHRASDLARYQTDAAKYRRFLGALGGRDVREALLAPQGGSVVQGTAILYDSDIGQSWVLVLARGAGETGEATVTLTSTDGRTIKLFPMKFDARGDGSSWLVTSANISRFNGVRVTAPDGTLLASGTVASAARD
jgi:hypothetical protein